MRVLFYSSLILLTAILAVAQEHPAFTAPTNSVYVGAEGKYEAAPDTALFQFNISAQEESSQAAYERASRAAAQVRQLLKSNQIDPKNAEIGFFSLQPVYDYRNPKRKLVGYRVNTSVSLKLKDFTKVAPVVQQLSDLDVTENQSLSYVLENTEAAKQHAVEDAVQKAREEAATVARASGRSLGELSYASVDVSQPMPMPIIRNIIRPMATVRAEAAAPVPTEEFTPQKIAVTAHINALFLLK